MNHNGATRKYRETMASLIRRGTTLRRWALSESVPVGTVYLSVKGHRNGPRAVAIRERLEKFING